MAETYDAFSGGVTYGGMRTKNDVRVLLCYMLKHLDGPFSRTGINTVLQNTELANFFEVNDALSFLEEAGLVRAEQRDGESYFTLTEAGREVADRLETDLSITVRQQAVSAAAALFAREKARGGADARIERLQKGYHVILSVRDGDTLMMQTVLFAPDSLQANDLCDRFLRDPAGFYSGLVDLITK